MEEDFFLRMILSNFKKYEISFDLGVYINRQNNSKEACK